jgi:DnaJ-class molecular chaperone
VSAFDNVVMVECRNDECPTLVEQLDCGDCDGDGHTEEPTPTGMIARVRCDRCRGRGQCEPDKDHRREAWQVTLGPSSYGRRFIVAGDERCPRCGGENMEVVS